MDKYIEAEALLGKTITAIKRDGVGLIDLTTSDGKEYRFVHVQDCCESVGIHDITGDLAALIGLPLTTSRKDVLTDWPEDAPKGEYVESFTWTALFLETKAAAVRVRFLGESNGYYGEGVDLEEVA
jgi:hypothetical protein